ncbi:hypothetical protein RJT34_14390 [Clitoria ternatea]|uniref:Uncharacterized protein n=1 Tax=Clitoria ternatea TaxID=43366 RepID=A0AAN9PMU6_CLITE
MCWLKCSLQLFGSTTSALSHLTLQARKETFGGISLVQICCIMTSSRISFSVKHLYADATEYLPVESHFQVHESGTSTSSAFSHPNSQVSNTKLCDVVKEMEVDASDSNVGFKSEMRLFIVIPIIEITGVVVLTLRNILCFYRTEDRAEIVK